MWKIIYLVAILILVSCQDSKQKSTNGKLVSDRKSNFIFTGDFYKGELIELKFNDSLVLQEIVTTDSLTLISKYFTFNYDRPFSFSVRTFYKDQIYLDTNLLIREITKGTNYKVTVTHPHPHDWMKYYKDGIPYKNWGYLPIDSALRFVHISRY